MKPVILILILNLSLLFFNCTSAEKNSVRETISSLIPKPWKMEKQPGSFTITPLTTIYLQRGRADLMAMGTLLGECIQRSSGIPVKIVETIPNTPIRQAILLEINEAQKPLGDEGYKLEVQPNAINLQAATPAGLFYGIQTIFQLLPADIYNSKKSLNTIVWQIPCVRIEDKPRFTWRGMHLDVSRHFFTKEFIFKYMDIMAMHKMNVFHCHLTDDQGWRIEIKKYPKLTQIGAWRADRTGITWNQRKPQKKGEKASIGGFYTQEDVKEIVSYAKSRFITVVPEIEMPGHSLAVMASYPKYSCTGGPFTVATGGYWPIIDVFCPGKDRTFNMIDDILTEVCDLFPGSYIHIGGDEVDKLNWKTCKDCQKRIKQQGLKNEEELQSYFIKRVEKILIAKNKKLIGWDEILQGGLAPEATVMSWRGMEGGIEAAQQGHDVVMSPTSYCYLDYYQGDPVQEPEAIGGFLPLEKVYEFEPVPPGLSEEQAKHILGAQGNMWTEYTPTAEDVEFMVLPRMCALAEIVWSDKDQRSLADFLNRMAGHYTRLDAANIHYRVANLQGIRPQTAFMEKAHIEIKLQEPYTEIRITVDGSEPTKKSSLYKKPFDVTETVTLQARGYLKNGEAGRVMKGLYEKQTPLAAISDKALQAGLNYSMYPIDHEIKSVDELQNFTATSSGISSIFKIQQENMPKLVGLVFTGCVHAPKKGIYEFTTATNDGSRLWIGEKLVVDSDGPHSTREKSGQIALAAGWHPIRLAYFDVGGARELRVYYQSPGFDRCEIPAEALMHSQN